MKTIVNYYCFIVSALLLLSGFLSSRSVLDVFASWIYFPVFVYFALLVAPKNHRSFNPPRLLRASVPTAPPKQPLPAQPLPAPNKSDLDADRRDFIKLIGSAGLGLFFFAIFTRKAQAAFFGSVPGPGTVALKDSLGNKIDPAEKHPTDGYRISEIDDSTSVSYYGFVNKSGAWFIQREDSSGAHRYAKGNTAFAANWTNRASLTYDYFHNVF